MQGSPEVRIFSTMHDDNLDSENPQPYLVEKGTNVTLTCTAKGPFASYYFQPYEINWFGNASYLEMAHCTNGKRSPVKTCNLTLWWPDVRGNYACQATNSIGCTYKQLELKVAGESRLIQVSNYYYYYYYYYCYYYYCYCYCYYCYYYIIIIKGPMLTNFACIALRPWPGNVMKKHAKDLS